MNETMIEGSAVRYFGHVIPPFYQDRLQKGELFAVAAYDEGYDDELIGAVVIGERDGWAEILHVGLTPYYRSAEYAADLIGGRLFDLQGQPEIAGVFAEIPVSGEDDLLADAFRHEGFELNFGGGGVLTFPLGQLDTGKLMKNVRGADILPLAYADDDILRRITARIQADPRPVPVDLPIPWDSYDPVLSMIRMEGGVPAGLVLVERGRNRLTVSLCYDSGAEGVLKLISALAEQALETEEQDTEILVAVVQRKLYSVVKHLVPEAAQTALMKAYLPFVHRLPFERYAFRTQETEEGTDHA